MNMTRTCGGYTGDPAPAPTPRRPTRAERALVLAGFAVAALCTAAALVADAGTGFVGALWLAAIVWTVAASLALALRRGLVHRDWSAFGHYELPDGRDDRIDWTSRTGAYAYLPIRERNQRLMSGD